MIIQFFYKTPVDKGILLYYEGPLKTDFPQ